MAPQRQPRIGDNVHYVLHAGPNMGSHRPAVVVRTDGEVQLQVFAAGNGKMCDMLPNVFWRYTVPYDADGRLVGSWHWPEWSQPVVKPTPAYLGEEHYHTPHHD